MKKIITLLSIVLVLNSFAQNKCKYTLIPDSTNLHSPSQKELVEFIEVKIKNNYQVQLIKHGQKKYLKIIVKDNLGYGQSGSLLLYSNKKQYFNKDITLRIIDENSAYFLLDLNPNYLLTLKENGLTSIIFRESVEFTIPKQDSESVKQLAACFTELIEKK